MRYRSKAELGGLAIGYYSTGGLSIGPHPQGGALIYWPSL